MALVVIFDINSYLNCVISDRFIFWTWDNLVFGAVEMMWSYLVLAYENHKHYKKFNEIDILFFTFHECQV